MKIGDKVTYKKSSGKDAKGTIHAIRYVDTKSGKKVLSYLIDTGKDEHLDEIVTDKDEKNIFVRQPEQVEVQPENVHPA